MRSERISKATIRQLFNESPYPEQIEHGQLRAEFLHDKALQFPHKKGEPPGTRSQVIRYLDSSNQVIVEISQYLRPDGTLGASGKPDPKRLRLGETMYHAEIIPPEKLSGPW